MHVYSRNQSAMFAKFPSLVLIVRFQHHAVPAILRLHRLMLKLLAFVKLQGISGIPKSPFMLDEYAVCYEFISGNTLKDTPPEAISDDYFFQLEDLVKRMHERNLVHLDIRNRRNIMVTDDGKPALLDFQSCLNLEHIPNFFHNILIDIDYSGVYKNWYKVNPRLLDDKRKARLDQLNKKRSLWLFKGYPKSIKGDRRK